MDRDRQNQLREFVAYAKTLKGDEKGEAQVFLDRLFQAFSQRGYKEAGATLEQRVAGGRGTTVFADLVWKPIVLIEMKKRGEDLSRHLLQVADYWRDLAPGRPRYVVLCNFDEFRIYDFDQSVRQPQDTLTLDELPERYEPLNFMWPTPEKVRFRVDREKVTREAAALLSGVYKRVLAAHGPELAQRFVLQALICLFSEDIGLLPKHFFTQLLDECVDPPKSFDLLGNLFRAMNSPGGTPGGRYAGVPYFNGGIFSKSAAVELEPDHEIAMLKRAATYNWAEVSPDIFGTIFQQSLDKDDRHALGAHYTSHADIMRIVGPTIIQPWQAAIEAAVDADDPLAALRGLQERLGAYRVLDPACGSGNFLYIAYRELKHIEVDLAARIAEATPRSKGQAKGQQQFGVVTSRQFFGMDIIPFAVELAKVTMTLAHKLAIDELHIEEKALPLDNLDGNILCKDALITGPGGKEWAKGEKPERSVWPEAEVIVGNPPFLGAKRLKPERGADYVKAVRSVYADVPGMADYCVYWIRRSHDHLRPATAEQPFGGRAGLVGTQNIRNNQSRVGGLDHVVASGTIVEAVENQPWSGEANVHVSIANWVKHEPSKRTGDPIPLELEAALRLPLKRRLWARVDPKSELFEADSGNPGVVTVGKRGKPLLHKSYEMAMRECGHISSALSDQTDVGGALVLACNSEPKRVYQGNTPGHIGFVLSPAEAKVIVRASAADRSVVHPYLTGRELVTGDGRPERFVIDFEERDQLQASASAAAFAWVEARVLPAIIKRASVERAKGDGETVRNDQLDRWWRHWRSRADRALAIKPLALRYVACSRLTKRPIFMFIDKRIWPADALQTFIFDDDYSFGVLQSAQHWHWFVTKCAKMKSDFTYTAESVFDTFPWPQSPSKKQILAVAKAGRAVRAIRAAALPTIKGGLRALYRTLELPGKNPLKEAHADLDAAVLAAYGFRGDQDLLRQLLTLNLSVAAAIERGEPVTAPGVPAAYGDPADLVTEDCIRP